jgi:hypothetical protein
MMVLAADEVPKSSVVDLSARTIQVLQMLGYWFLEFIGDAEIIRRFHLDNGCFHFCFNYDRDTIDRESGMTEKRFHLHLNYWSGEEVDQSSPVCFGTLSSLAWRRRLLDPIAFLGASIAYDLLGGQVVGVPLLPLDHDRDLQLGLPAGIKIRFDNWSILTGWRLTDIIRTLHIQFYEGWRRISRALTGTDTPPGAWYRHRLLPLAEIIQNIHMIPGLSEMSQAGLVVLANTLRDIPQRLMEFLKQRQWLRVRHLSMGGLNYSLGLYSQARNRVGEPLINSGPVYLVVQFKLFADIGGAGISYMGDVPVVRISRGEGFFFTAEDIQRRTAFQQAFIDFSGDHLQKLSGVNVRGKVGTL